MSKVLNNPLPATNKLGGGGTGSQLLKQFDLMNDLSYLKDFKKPKSHAVKARELSVIYIYLLKLYSNTL